MKNKFSFVFLFLLTISLYAQDINPFKKGSVMLFWGWNNAKYTKSDIRFKGPGYDFQLNHVVAHDRQTPFEFKTYFGPKRVTIPQTNAQLAYFIKDNLAVVLSLDHMKYVMDQDQVVDFRGYIKDQKYSSFVKNNQVDLTSEEFLTFEHTDGLNYVNLGVEKYLPVLDKKNFDVFFGYGIGGGILYPKTNAKLFGNERSDRFHIAGFGTDVRANLNFVLWNHVIARLEAKYGYINMPDIKTTLSSVDKAAQDFAFGQVNFGIGYTFNTRKQK